MGVFVVIVFVVIVIVSIIAVVVKSNNKQKNDGGVTLRKADAQRIELKRTDEVFPESVAPVRAKAAPQRREPSKTGKKRSADSEEKNVDTEFAEGKVHTLDTAEKPRRTAGIKGSDYVDARDYKARLSVMTDTFSTSHHEEHCAVNHETNDKYVEEKNIPVTNSIGGVSTEGCPEHYFSRFVKVDAKSKEEADENNRNFAAVIVLGEVLNSPRFRALYRSHRK